MKRRAGFTLIELLVVIGIIVVLIAILLPALGKARQHARTVVCLANQKALGHALQLYYMEWGVKDLGVLSPPHDLSNISVVFDDWDYRLLGRGVTWTDYLMHNGRGDESDKVRFCPETAATGNPWGAAHLRWNDGRAGSYAINNWLYSIGYVRTQGTDERFYRQTTLRNGATIPAFIDCVLEIAVPFESDPAPADLEDPWGWGTPRVQVGALTYACMRRHGFAVNVVFVDGHAETVKLPNLWTLKWSKDWSRTEPAVVPGK